MYHEKNKKHKSKKSRLKRDIFYKYTVFITTYLILDRDEKNLLLHVYVINKELEER